MHVFIDPVALACERRIVVLIVLFFKRVLLVRSGMRSVHAP